jgi:hypothetical protein
MRSSKGLVLLVLVAIVTLSGIGWYLARGGIDNERPAGERLETDSQPWAVPEESLETGPAPPEEQPQVELPAQ